MPFLTRLLPCLALILAGPEVARAQTGAPVTIFIARHAEKEAEGTDPSLNPTGVARAQALAHTLRDAGVTRIFTTEFKRTRETAAPLAEARHLPVTVVPGRALDSLVTLLQNLPAGSRALVVSHSNLVPVLVEKLSGERAEPMTDAEYDRLYAVTVSNGRGVVWYLHFGVPTPAGGGAMK
jgi:broad specificity phosphatase PhoE